ncbi:MAG: molecular chaperone DnaJ [Bradymonadia bacterium]|jgi:molecular chaperone DnaJ
MSQDYYKLLGVSRGASDDELKKAYRKLARELHPDRNPDDEAAEQRFKEVSEAYSTLSDPEKKRLYDTYGADGVREGFNEGGFGGFGGQGVDLGDLFSQFGGGGGFGGGSRAGRDVELNLNLTFEKAARGFKTKFRYRKPGTCPTCRGAGMAGNARCRTCGGQGQVEQEKSLEVNIPPGAQHGDRIRLRGKGGSGSRGAPAGDLLLTLQVGSHATLAREGVNLVAQTTIGAVDALLGVQVEVEGLDGTYRVTVPPGMASGKRLRVSNKGITRRGKTGHLLVEVAIDASLDAITDEVRAALVAMRVVSEDSEEPVEGKSA